ncbi:MAG TPA: DUF4118 domain-containing protein [Candidatus Didemnitutus sp.]|nr:DUF4118 domain-containing protein [Candidatus Didemnitutus sp.]
MLPIQERMVDSADGEKRATSFGGAWRRQWVRTFPVREYLEVFVVIGAVTLAGWFMPFTYRAFGHIYLMAVIVLSLRVGRIPVLVAALVSAVAWNYVFMPPRLSFSVLHFEDSLMLGTYLAVALIGGQLTARIRAQEREERQRERRATALYLLARAVAGARDLDVALATALQQADALFDAKTALLLRRETGVVWHAAGTFTVDATNHAIGDWAMEHREPAGRFTGHFPTIDVLHIPLVRDGRSLGVFAVRFPADLVEPTAMQRELIDGFAAQIALLVEREELRQAGEREKLFAESDRLHRTLLDSVSHELKTPLAVLRAAGEKLGAEDKTLRTALVGEVRMATRRLDHLVGNLLNQNRLESGVLRPQLDWCDVRDLITAARRATADALAGRSVRLEVPEDIPLFFADVPLMENALANLLLNAGHHTAPGSPVLICAGRETRHGEEQVYVRVADRGAGLPPGLRDQPFQKFRRGAGARPGGLGLGLSIVHGFMLAQGGDVTAGDHAGGGAQFTLHLPHREHGLIPTDER